MKAAEKDVRELQRQLDALNEATLALARELSLERLLQTIVDLARDLGRAQYAALAVPGPDGALKHFVISGLSQPEQSAIGDPPKGRGLLGLVLTEGQSLRLADLRQHSQSAGVPPHHPTMTSFLGIPIKAKGEISGILYLTNRQEASAFSEEDQRLVEMLATHAAVAIERARLYEQIENDAEAKADMLEELRAANEQLRELDRLKSEFVSLVSHGLRAPLTNMQGAVELLLESIGEDEEAGELLQVLNEQIGRLSRLVKGVLQVTRIEAGQLVADQQALDVHPLLERIVRQLRVRSQEHEFVLPSTDNIPRVWADPDLMEEILSNILDNAVKYSPDGSQIAVTVQPAEEHLLISVSDQGVGIPDQELDKIFDKFYRVRKSPSGENHGHGLGLYVTRNLVEAQGGRIWVESTPGEGSRFSFILPRAGQGAEAPGHAEEAPR